MTRTAFLRAAGVQSWQLLSRTWKGWLALTALVSALSGATIAAPLGWLPWPWTVACIALIVTGLAVESAYRLHNDAVTRVTALEAERDAKPNTIIATARYQRRRTPW